MKKLVSLIVLFVYTSTSFGQGVYDINSITLIEINFVESDWDAIMDANYAAGMDERLVGSCAINGQFYDSVGVAFKGNSTYNASSLKNPLNIQLDYVLDQKYQGYSTFKLSNGSKDPSFIREVFSYEIGRNYMDMPLSNYAKVMINGSYYGLFSSSEAIDGDYHERRLFCDDDNTRFKCNPVSVFEGGSSLEYLGADSSAYFDYYELKSDFGWNEMVAFTQNLDVNLATIEQYLDVDRVLWMLAFNSVLVNLDSYTGPFKQNYYMIKDDNDRFLPIIWDLNQSIGSFSMISGGGGGGTGLSDLTNMDLFLRDDDPSFPLIYQLFSVPRYRKMYLAHVKTMVEEQFADVTYYDRAEEIQSIISDEVSAEPNGFYSPIQFTSNLYETEGGGGPGPGGAGVFGISEVMNPRVAYLQGLTEWSYIAPTISGVSTSPATVTAYVNVTIKATILNATYAYLGYLNDLQDAFKKVEMFDDGAHGDGDAGDGVYGVTIPTSAKDMHYYIYADNDLAGKFSPVRAEHEYYHLIIQSNVVINEVMAENYNSVADQDGEFDDWVELYNLTGASIDLSGYYLSDRPNSNPLMWQIPNGTVIPANGYLIIWLDEDTLQDGLHANFKMSASGESISLSDAGGFELNRVKLPETYAGTTFGRFENGTGPFIRMFPTFAANNSYTALDIEEEVAVADQFIIYPNPANEFVTIYFSGNSSKLVQVYDMSGQIIYENSINTGEQISVMDWVSGIYLIVLPQRGLTKKLIVK